MKITFFRHSLLSRGGDKMVLAHARHLVEAGHQVTIRAGRVDTVFPVDGRIRLERIAGKSRVATLLDCLKGGGEADIVVADIVALAFLLYARHGRKVVYFAQDYDESYYLRTWQRLLIRSLYFGALSIFRIPTIAVSEYLARLLVERFRAKVAVAANGIDEKVFYPEPDPGLIEAKMERKAVLVLAREDERKGFDLAQEVLCRLADGNGAPIEVWTVGSPAEGLFPGMVCRDFGYLTEPQLRRVMSSADVFLYPSRHEGYGLMVLEAFACRCPVVTTTAVPYAEDGVNSLVSRTGDVGGLATKVARLLGDEQLAKHLTAAGKVFAEEHSLAASAERFESHLKAVC